jgi:3-oxoadipate enol-lactonase
MASTSGTVDFNQLGDAAVNEWMRAAPAAHDEMQAKDIHPAIGERMAREQPALAQLYWQILVLADGTFREHVRRRLGELRVKPPALLRDLRTPVLFITGDEDWVFPSAAGPALAARALDGRAVRVRQAGHSVYFERAAEFNEILGRFI